MSRPTETEIKVADVNTIIDSLNIDDELIGDTTGDDGKTVSLESTPTPTPSTVTVATVGVVTGSNDAATIAKAALERARTTPSAGSNRGGDADSKHAKCREIFVEFYGKNTRKEIIDLYIAVAGCKEKGAATYYQQDTHDAKLLALVAERDTKATASTAAE